MTKQHVRRHLRRRLQAYGSQRDAAQAWRISPAYLSDVLSGRRDPGPKILKLLKLVKTYGGR